MAQNRQAHRLGVPGLDEELGEVPRGYVILVAGYPGSGKTTFASQFVYEGLREGERALYVSFVEPRDEFYRNSLRLGMDFRPYESEGLFRYYEALNVASPDALSDLVQDVLAQVDSMVASRLVVDSVTAISQLAGDAPRAREVLHSALYAGLKRRGVTTVLIAELPIGSDRAGLGPEEFIADGVIVMKYRLARGKMERYAEVRKMRGFSVRLARMPIAITDRGVAFPAPLSISSLPSAVRPRRTINLLGLQVPEGAGVLIAHDPSVDPLWFDVAMVVAPALRAGLRVRYSSYIHGQRTLRHAVEECLGQVPDSLTVESFDASSLTAGEAELETYLNDTSFKPDLVVVEGMNVLAEFLERSDYMGVIYRVLNRRASMGITTVHLYAAHRERVWEAPLVNYYDYVLYAGPEGQGLRLEYLRSLGSVTPAGAVAIEAKDVSCGSAVNVGVKQA